MNELSVIADYGDLCGEGPLWDPVAGYLYWTDCVGRKFYRYHSASGRHEVMKEGLEINACAMDRSGGFVITNNSGIWAWDGRDAVTPIAAEADGSRCQVNDSIADPAGRLFTGSWFYDPQNEYPLGKLIRVDTDGTARVVDEGIHLANGLAFSPDERTLYFADSVGRIIYAYDYDKASGDVCNRRVLVKVPEEEGLPDGLTVDASGFLWSAQWYGSCVVRYDPDGKVERRIAVPAKQVSSVAFGGPDLTDLFITSAARSEPMPVMPPGYDPASGNFGGQLYRIHLEIQGKPEYRTAIRAQGQ
jgi:D-xylonolactonase